MLGTPGVRVVVELEKFWVKEVSLVVQEYTAVARAKPTHNGKTVKILIR